jgi:phospholipase A1
MKMFVRSRATIIAALALACVTFSSAKADTDDAFKVSEISCWDLATLEDFDRASAILLVYGFVAGEAGLDSQSGSLIQKTIEEVNSVCEGDPDLTIASAMQNAMSKPSPTVLTSQELAPVEARRISESASFENPFALTPHQPNYILPATFSDDLDFTPYGPFEPFLKDSEVKFQISLKSQLASNLMWGSSLEVGYTQVSYWQLYAEDDASAPFRETNYQPEVMWRIPLDFEVFTHQSNGQIRPLSRSWNRLSGELVATSGSWVFSATAQTRVDDPKFDDNPDVADYMGRFNLGMGYRFRDHTLALGVKNGMGSRNKAGAEFNWIFPITKNFNGMVQVYHGYGENLIDMENKNTRVGLGVALNSWF